MLIEGKNINLRTALSSDAEYIFDMRKDACRTKYLSVVSGTVNDQKKWIKNYKLREDKKEEYYFIIESKSEEKFGLVRIYDFKDDSFCWGSWLIKDTAPKTTAIESALQVYEFAFYTLGFQKSHFDVRKGNEKVIAFHKRIGATIVREDDINYYFNYKENTYEKIRKKYKRYL